MISFGAGEDDQLLSCIVFLIDSFSSLSTIVMFPEDTNMQVDGLQPLHYLSKWSEEG